LAGDRSDAVRDLRRWCRFSLPSVPTRGLGRLGASMNPPQSQQDFFGTGSNCQVRRPVKRA
jgi:hypothetical protein